MLLLLNTAKTFAKTSSPEGIKLTEAVFESQAQGFVQKLSSLSIRELGKLMTVSSSIAQLNHDRYSQWKGTQPMPALHAFAGEIYKKFRADSLLPDGWKFAQKHLRILSGLYGLLRPMDAIRPYRLEMETKLGVGTKKNLYEFWRELITDELNRELVESKSKWLVNLASHEYFSVIEAKKISYPIINVIFQEQSAKGPRIVAIQAKWARGLMARYIVDHQLTEPEGMKKFDWEGYRFDEKRSTENEYFFIRI